MDLARSNQAGKTTQKIQAVREIASTISASNPREGFAKELHMFQAETLDKDSDYCAGNFADRVSDEAKELEPIRFMQNISTDYYATAKDYFRIQFALLRKLHKELAAGNKLGSAAIQWLVEALALIDKQMYYKVGFASKAFIDEIVLAALFPDEAYKNTESVETKFNGLLKVMPADKLAILLQQIQARFGVEHFISDDKYFDAVKAAKQRFASAKPA